MTPLRWRLDRALVRALERAGAAEGRRMLLEAAQRLRALTDARYLPRRLRAVPSQEERRP